MFYKLEREKMSPHETAQIAAEAKANNHEMGCSCQECLMSIDDFLKEAHKQNFWGNIGRAEFKLYTRKIGKSRS
jgi:hypothetical protein